GMFSGLTGIVEHLPYMMAVGNHDTRGFQDYANGIGRYYSEPAEFFCRQCRGSYPYNGPEGWKTETYAFDYGNAHFSMIAVNGPEDVNRWLLRDIPASDRVWKIGSYHFPIYYSGPELSNDDAYPVMREGMEQLDVLFSGHEHNFSRSFPIRNESLFDRPSQGTVHYELGNSNDNPPGTMTVKKVWHAAYYPQATSGSSYAVVEVFRDKLILTDYLDDGRIVDQCVIDKAKDEILPHAVAPVYRRPRLFYKGVDLGIGQKDCYPEQKDGVWFAPLCVMFSVICAEVVKEPGKITLGVYGHRATFTEGSDIAVTERGEVKLPAPVYRGMRGQLYIPVDAVVSCFDMKWNYAARNNFLSVEHATEQIPFTEQP
ncbi:MAG: metallophosphoesterase, partial [Clostridia bacterium]|nr:metallophosphoesterase [Clostridia bacterium]